jgi:hypothetical protein
VSQLYDQIAALDKGVADRWKARSHDNPQHKLTPADVDSIISPLLKTEKKESAKITEKQAEAIVALVRGTGLEKGALDRIRFWVKFAEKSLSLDLQPLVSADDLLPINQSLATASKISFASPGTKINYAPHDYMAIAELIQRQKIMVFQARMGDLFVLTEDDGEYRSDFNMLFIYDKRDNVAFTGTIVHECTHAIQDWLDIAMQRRFAEADAYIAGFAMLSTQQFAGDLSDAAFRASRFVIDRKAQSGNKDWQKAYDQVVKAYDNSHTDGRELMRNTEKGETESDQYKTITASIDQRAREFGEWALDTLKGSVDGLTAGVSNAIP